VRARRSLVLAGCLIGLLVGIDQALKLVVRSEAHALPYTVISGVVIQIVHNRGISFGNFAGAGPLLTVVISLVTLGMIVALFLAAPRFTLALALVVGGSIANLIDRLRWGYVIDFVTLPHWPTFNMADVAITAGAVLLVWRLLTTT